MASQARDATAVGRGNQHFRKIRGAKAMAAAVLCCLFLAAPLAAGAVKQYSQRMTVNGHTVTLQVPEGMRLQFVASLNNPRFISTGPDGELLIGSRSTTIYRLRSPYDQPHVLVAAPGSYIHSTVYREGTLYAADTAAVYAAPYTGETASPLTGDFRLVTVLPSATGGHSSRTIVHGPDNRLYVGLGISGNCSDDEYLSDSYPFERRRGGVFVLTASETLAAFSSGLRNPIGLAFHPQTGVLYATNAGPDNLGYFLPPEILAPLSSGSFHGMPWFQYYQGSFHSGECAQTPSPRPASQAVEPAALFPARSTPMALAFLHTSRLGGGYFEDAVVAVHGSWATIPGQGISSRRPPNLSLVRFANGSPTAVEPFVSGFQRADGSRFARPCGVAVGADGNIYFTSDGGDVEGIFRLVRTVNARQTSAISSVYGLLLGGRR